MTRDGSPLALAALAVVFGAAPAAPTVAPAAGELDPPVADRDPPSAPRMVLE